jgi:hypothetical protein
VSEERPRYIAPSYLWAYMQRRRYYLAVVLLLIIVVVVLLNVSSSLPDYEKNLSLNLAADLIGTIVVLFLVVPLIERADLRRDSVLDRFDHRAFIRQAADARRRIVILEMWTDLLQGSYQRPFLDALKDALEQGVEVRILLLDPDARAAEQRADDLLRRTNVVDNILDNLLVLHEFRQALSESFRKKIEIRVYSALPPVQMYRVDDQVLVSFYPANMTSWNAAQYQTNPRAQLGTFVGTKFDELWDAPTTRTLDQFRTIAVRVDSDADEKAYDVRFVTFDEETYVACWKIASLYSRDCISDLSVSMVDCNAKGERDVLESYYFADLEVSSEDLMVAKELFARKYGQEDNEVILKLIKVQSE